jgi:molybdate transport system regulatory protein
MGKDFEYRIRIRLSAKGTDPAYAFGPGTADLLRGIRETSSLNQAAKRMGMAYSKAWKAINQTEEQLGFVLIERLGPGGSVLTRQGEQMLALFDEMTRRAGEAIQSVLDAWVEPGPND